MVTGDLVHDEPEAYPRLRRHFTALGCPVYCLPGNHDDPRAMREVFSRPPVTWQRSARHGRWHLVFLDSSVPGEVGGHLGAQELQALDEALGRHPRDPAVVFLHHPAQPCGMAWLDRGQVLDDAEAFFAVLDAHANVRAVLWGHVHQEYEEVRNGVRLLGTPSTMVQFLPEAQEFALDDADPGYRWLALADDGTLETGVVRVALADSGRGGSGTAHE